MKVELNRKTIDVTPGIDSLQQLLASENLDGTGVAVAIDNRLAPRTDWESTKLVDGMKITVIRAVCGG